MPTLLEILKDPNYVNANAETKRAIFDRHAPKDPNYVNANTETQQAIRSRFGVESAPSSAAPATPAGQIPSDPSLKAPDAVPPQEPMGQKITRFVRPIAEGLGAAGGAVLGTSLGPAGAVGGAGLGYGLAKGGMDTLETALGYRRGPQSAAEGMVEGARDVLTGATMEAGGRVVLPIVAKGAGAVAARVADAAKMVPRKAAIIAQQAAGPDLAAIRTALNNAEPGRTVAQSTANITSPTWQALVDQSLKRDPRYVMNTLARQADESLNALARQAGGDTAAATKTAVGVEKTALNAITTPMREAALQAADAGALQPLKSDKVTTELTKILGKPEYAGNDIVHGAVKNVGEEIAAWTSKNTGVIPAEALDAIRKNAVNAAVAKLRPGMDATAQKNAASGVLSQIKPVIDDAIEAAGGPGYKQYLARHTEGMRKIAEQKLTGEALRLWKEDKNGFIKLVNNESPDVVEKILGPTNYDIAKELAANAYGVLKTEAGKIKTDQAVKAQVSEGQEALRLLLEQNRSRFKIPNWLKPGVALSNRALDVMERMVDKKTMKLLTEAMKSPKGAEDLLAAVPAEERVKLLKILRNPDSWGATGQAVRSSANALAPSDQRSENALAP